MLAMQMDVRLSNTFRKQYRKADHKVQQAFKKRLHIFMQDPYHPLLNNHKLKGRYQGMRSISITGDWRAVYLEKDHAHGHVKKDKVITFYLLGTHSELYQ